MSWSRPLAIAALAASMLAAAYAESDAQIVQQYAGSGTSAPCSAFGATAGTCAQGNDARFPTGNWPTTTNNGDLLTFNGATGAPQDSGVLLSSLAPLASPSFTGTVTLPGSGTLTSTADNFAVPTTVTSTSFGLTGNITAASIYGTSGIRYKNSAVTIDDTASSGTVAVNYDNVWGGSTLTASNATTLTLDIGSYFKVDTCSTNVTCTAKYALGADSIYVAGNVNAATFNAGTQFNATTLGSATAVDYGFNSAKTGWYSTSQDANAALSVNGTLILDYGITGSNVLSLSTYLVTSSNINSNVTTGFQLTPGTPSGTSPDFLPRRSDTKAGIGADAAGDVSLIADNAGTATEIARVTGTGLIMENGVITLKSYTVSGLPSGSTGALAVVTDATSCNYGSAPTGGGSTQCKVAYLGGSWVAN